MLSRDSVLGVLRHVLTFGGGFVVAKFNLDPAAIETAVGAIITLAGLVWSVADKTARKA